MARYDRGYDYGLRGIDQTAPDRHGVRTRYVGGGGQGRGFGGGYGGGGYAARGYDRDLGRGTADARGGYDRDYGDRGYDAFGRPTSPFPNRVTARYNLDYVREQHPGEHPVNYTSYGGDREGRVGDMREYWDQYRTVGGTSTWRGGGLPVGWERESGPRYDRDYPRRGGGRPGRGWL
jgi:hypothetical protein